jgi:Cof subfamily protein (haloacid dehalogenase superfamily)
MSESIRLVALDLDGTLFNDNLEITEENQNAIRAAIASGTHVIISTGRPYVALPVEKLTELGIQYAITSNGASVYHIPSGKRLMSYTLAPESVQKILDLTAGMHLAYEAFIDGVAYAQADYVENPGLYGAANATQYIQSTRIPISDFRSFLLEHRTELESIDLVVSSEEQMAELRPFLQTNIPDLYITSSVHQLLELSHRDAGKHSGVRFVANLLGISPSEIAAFGDGDNDADMLSFVGCGIAVENASPSCLAAADFVTAHHREDGVAHGIYNILKL